MDSSSNEWSAQRLYKCSIDSNGSLHLPKSLRLSVRIMKLHLLCCLQVLYNPLGNLNSGRRPWAKLIGNASLQRVFDAAIAKLHWRLVSRCFYVTNCVFFYDNVELRLMRCNSTKQSPDSNTEMSLTIYLAVCRILDKLHSFSNILCTCSMFIKMWAQI